jgi:hypothetical protein
MLLIHWLLLSDPDRPLSIDRPRLSGQERPGLGLLPECLSLLFYSREFRFLEQEAEGRFQAIARALEGIPLALASEAVQEGCPIDRANGLPILWEPAEQGMPLCDPLRLHLRSPGYRLACAEAGSGLAPGVDWDR